MSTGVPKRQRGEAVTPANARRSSRHQYEADTRNAVERINEDLERRFDGEPVVLDMLSVVGVFWTRAPKAHELILDAFKSANWKVKGPFKQKGGDVTSPECYEFAALMVEPSETES